MPLFLENLDELINKAVGYWSSAEEPTLDGFLEEVALVADIDNVDGNDDRVLLTVQKLRRNLPHEAAHPIVLGLPRKGNRQPEPDCRTLQRSAVPACGGADFWCGYPLNSPAYS